MVMQRTRPNNLTELEWIRREAATFRKRAEETTLKGVLSKHFETTPDEPFLLEDKQARAFGFDIPDAWRVKAFREPTNGRNINFRQVNPQGWEIIDDTTFLSPTGETITLANLEALEDADKLATGLFKPVEQEPVAGELPEIPIEMEPDTRFDILEQFRIEELSPEGLPQFDVRAAIASGIDEQLLVDAFTQETIDRAKTQPTGLVWDSDRGQYVPATLDLRVTKDFYARFPELLPEGISPTLTPVELDELLIEQSVRMEQLNNAMRVILPNFLADIPENQRDNVTAEYISRVVTDPQIQGVFVDTVLETGRTPETETLLKAVGLSDANIDELFATPDADEDIIETPQSVVRPEPEWENARTGEIITRSEKDKRYPKGWEAELDEWRLTTETAKNYLSVFKILGEGLTKLPKQLGASILQAFQGFSGASVVNKDWADEKIAEASEDLNKFAQDTVAEYGDMRLPINVDDLATLPQSIGFSLTSMGAGLGVGVPISLAPVPGARVAAWAAGTTASGAVAFNMASYQIMQQYLELKNEEMKETAGRDLTLEEENTLKKDFSAQAIKYGLWEAVPEAISNLAFARILTLPLGKMIGRNLASQVLQKVGGMYGQEFLTETITQKGQSAIEVEAGLREGKITWVEAFKEIAPQTFLLTTILGGAGQVTVSSVSRIKKSLKKEIGDEPIFAEINKNITDDIFAEVEAQAVVPEEVIEPIVPTEPGVTPTEVVPTGITPNMPESYVEAKKRPDGKWQLFFTGTRNEVFPNEFFTSVSEAKMAFKVAKAKLTEVPVTEPGQPEAGLQASLLPDEVPAKEVRPKGKGREVQISMDEQVKLEQAKRVVEEEAPELRQAYEAQAEIEGLKEWLKTEPATNLVNLVNKAGWHRGEIKDLTLKQYRDITGSQDILPNILTKDRKHVRWEYALDSIATEMGYESSDALKEAIERSTSALAKIRELETNVKAKMVEKPLKTKPEPKPTKALISPTGEQVLTPAQSARTIDLFAKYIESESAIDAWELTRELRSETLADKAEALKARAEGLIVTEGLSSEDAINQAIKDTLAGELPTLTTDYLSDLTENMRKVLFDKVYRTLKDEPFEMVSTATALTNALNGKPIPREPGAKGGSAFTRLQRVFGEEPKVFKAIEKMATEKKSLEDVVEGIFHETGREPIPVDQATADYLRNLSTSPMGQAWLSQDIPTLLKLSESKTPEQIAQETLELKIELAPAPIPVTRYEAPIEDAFKEIPLWPTPVRDNVVKALKELAMSPIDIGNFLRANKASFDFSFWRQQAPLIASHPISFAQANIEAWKSIWSQRAADSSWNSIIRDPLYQIYEFAAAEGGDFLRPAVLSKGMAQYAGTEEFGYTKGTGRLLPLITSKLPWVKISARAFETGTNEHNWLIFKNYYKAMLKLNEQYASGQKKLKVGESFDIQKEMIDFSKSLANFTARGSLGKFAVTAPELSALFFAPRASIGRILSVADLVNANPRVRKEAWKNASLFVSTFGGIILMGAAAGWWDVDDENPNSAEYMSIRIGNTRIDPWGGYRQFLTFFARAITGVGISSVTGAEYKTDPLDLVQNLLRGKASPLMSTILDFWRGKNFVGETVDVKNKKQWVERVAPFAVWDIYEAYVDDPLTAFQVALPAIVGAGVQTYTGDWKENANKLGLSKYDDNLPKYNIEDYWSDTASQFKGVDPETLTEKKGFDPRIKTMVEAKQVLDQTADIPNKKLISINADTTKGDTFVQYFEQWNDRETLVDAGDNAVWVSSELQTDGTYKTIEYKGEDALKAYDKKFPQAEQGNMSQTDYVSLIEYYSLPKEAQKQYLIDNPSINTNLRQDWLRSHPHENALLAMHGKSEFLTIEAYKEGMRLLKELDYPKQAWPDNMPTENVAQSHFDYRQAVDDWSSNSAEAQLVLAKDPDYIAWRNTTSDKLTTPEQPERYYELKVENRDANDAWGILSDKESPEYIEDSKERRAKLLETGDYKNYFDNEARAEAIAKTFPDEQIEAWVEHEQVSDEHGGNSPQAKVWAFENQEAYQKALDEELITDRGALPTAEERGLYEPWSFEAEKLKVTYTDESDFYKTLSSKSEFPNTYVDDVEERWSAFETEYPDSNYRIDLSKIEAHGKFFSEADVNLWAEREQIAIDSGSGNSGEVKVFYLDNPELHALAKEAGLVTSDMADWNEPVLRIDVKWRDKDTEYNAVDTTTNPETGIRLRDEWLELPENEEYRKDRIRRKGYGLNNSKTGYEFPDELVEDYVTFAEYGGKGKRQERMLFEGYDPATKTYSQFAQALYDSGEISDLPKPGEVPAVQFDNIYDQYAEQFDRLEGAGKQESIYFIPDKNERVQATYDLRFDKAGKLTEFGKAEIRRNGYADFVPEAYIERHVEYGVIMSESIPKDWPKTRTGTHNWYEDDWYLIEHPAYYKNIYLADHEARDFSKVPSREVFALYVQYEKLPSGKPRDDFRFAHRDLEAWGQKKYGWASITEKRRRADLSQSERVEEELRRLEELLR